MDSAPQIPSLLGLVSLLRHELSSSSCPDLQPEVVEISSISPSASECRCQADETITVDQKPHI